MPSFGLVAEGPTDHAVLKNILLGYFNDPDLVVNPLQPLRDATDAATAHGGWQKVVDYVQSEVFQAAFSQNDFLVIQIDTDCLHEKPFELDKRGEDGKAASPELLVERAKEKLGGLMRNKLEDEFIEKYGPRIIFAVAVDEIECWLLPLFYSDSNKAKTNNCLHKLNEKLARDKAVPVNPASKKPNQYRDLSYPFSKNKELRKHHLDNPSLALFVSEIETKTGIPLQSAA